MMPKLRFKEFDYPWDKKTLGDIFTISSGGTPNRNTPEFWVGGTIPWITTSLINFNIINTANEFITPSAVKKSSAKIFPINTILIAMYGQGKTRGKCAVLGIEATTNQACAALIPAADINTQFTFQYISGRYDEIREMSNLGGQENISIGIIKKISIDLPDLKEQTKIAGFLSCIDEKITLLNKQYELLCQYKKGMMQKIFSQELRFKNENGKDYPKWKYSVLGNVTYLITNGLVIDQNDQGKGYPVSRIETISERKINLSKVGYVDTSKNISNYRLNYGDMLFSNINSISHIGKIAYFDINEELYHGMNLLRIVIDNNNSSLFFYHQLTAESKKKYFESRANQAVSQASINQSELKRTPIWIPCIDEQTKIANFLSAIDDKITTKKIELDKLKTWKQGLLQQMFI